MLPTLAVFLFWILWVKSQAIDFNQHSRYLSELRHLQELDARINQNILQSRLGLLMFYDPIINELTELKKTHKNLSQIPTFIDTSGRTLLRNELQAHIQVWQKKEKLFQQFQSQNSILKNSLAYFPIATAEVLNQSTTSPTLADRVNKLLHDVLLFNLSPNDRELAPKINQEIEAMPINANPDNQNITLKNAITHAKIILKSCPHLDTLVEDLMTQPTLVHSEALFKTYERTYQQAINSTNLYRLWFYLLSTVAVVGIAAFIIRKLQIAAIALRRSEQKYRTIFANSQVGIGRTRLGDGLFLEVNQRYADIMGFSSPADLIGTRFTSAFYANSSDRQRILAELEQQGEVRNFEEQLRRADGSNIWVLLSLHPSPEEDCLDFVITDISTRKQTEEQLQQAMEAAKIANQAKSQFLSHMSHELRSPLNVILGFTQLILRNTDLSAQQQTYVDTINRSGEHLLALINDVLEMSKIEAGRVVLNETHFDLYALLDVVQAMFQYKAESKGLQLCFERDVNLPQYICSDESKLRQVLINLLGNAVKFTQIGRVILRANLSPADLKAIDGEALLISPQSPPIFLSFEVEDTGPGIPSVELDRLFEPFMQTEAGFQSQEGTGLGLSISRKFVQIMGGEIAVESSVNAGSCFRFAIPVHQSEPIRLTPQDRKVIGLEPGQPSYRILAVEDKSENRQFLVELLNSIGFEVREAVNGQEAIALCQHWLPHLIWMDLRMPVLDGYEATKQIKATANPAPTIIALTGSAFEEGRADAISCGCDDFIRKPIPAAIVFAKMAEYLGVRYLYAEASTTDTTEQNAARHNQTIALHPVTQNPHLPALVYSDLSVMSPVWIEQLRQAAMRVNSKLLSDAIAEIPASQMHLANALTDLAMYCRFEEIVALTQPPDKS
ncbi:MAG: DAHL domain-containing protein [Thermosynechococcaceae cyanobacterium]